LPLITIATAMPRRFVNQSEVSATNGAKVAEQPNMPASTPWTIANCRMLPDMPARIRPLPSPSAPSTTGTITP
jgi:hypothetical protein